MSILGIESLDPSEYSGTIRRGIADGTIRYAELSRSSGDWPEAIRGVRDLDTLHVVGDASVLEGPLVAVTGSRRPSPEQLDAARECGRAAARAGVGLVCGGAIGCDLEAATACLANGGRIVVVPGTGVDVLYPRAASAVMCAAATGFGCVCSPFPLGTEPRRWQFPRRNELIAAMADLMVCPAARRPSGSLSTVELALDAGVPVLLVEGSGITERDLFPRSSLVDTLGRDESLVEGLVARMSDARPRRAALEVASRLSDALPHWGFYVAHEADGHLVECEASAGEGGYDYVGMLDMRGRDPLVAREWQAAAAELAHGFDLDEEVGLCLGASGSPGVETVVADLKDVRDRLLPELAAAVSRVSEAVARELGGGARNAPLSEAARTPPHLAADRAPRTRDLGR